MTCSFIQEFPFQIAIFQCFFTFRFPPAAQSNTPGHRRTAHGTAGRLPSSGACPAASCQRRAHRGGTRPHWRESRISSGSRYTAPSLHRTAPRPPRRYRQAAGRRNPSAGRERRRATGRPASAPADNSASQNGCAGCSTPCRGYPGRSPCPGRPAWGRGASERRRSPRRDPPLACGNGDFLHPNLRVRSHGTHRFSPESMTAKPTLQYGGLMANNPNFNRMYPQMLRQVL